MRTAGPFYGEFGWELMMWIPWLRYLAKQSPLKIFARPGNEIFYQGLDVTSYEMTLSPKVVHSDCQHVYVRGKRVEAGAYPGNITPHDLPVKFSKSGCPIPPEFSEYVRLGEPGEEYHSCQVALHKRNRQWCSGRNWHFERWRRLQDAADNLAEIGFFHIGKSGTSLMVGHEIGDQLQKLRKSKLCIGASSGPMHMAALCGTPLVVWSGNPGKDRERYDRLWNPFNVKVYWVGDTWDPEPEQVLEKVKEALSA